jgi:hypothetical protein
VIFSDLPQAFREPLDFPDARDRANFGTFKQVIDGWAAANESQLRDTLARLDQTKSNSEAA